MVHFEGRAVIDIQSVRSGHLSFLGRESCWNPFWWTLPSYAAWGSHWLDQLLWFRLGFQVLGVGYELAKCLDIQSDVVSTISLIVRESTCTWRFISWKKKSVDQKMKLINSLGLLRKWCTFRQAIMAVSATRVFLLSGLGKLAPSVWCGLIICSLRRVQMILTQWIWSLKTDFPSATVC